MFARPQQTLGTPGDVTSLDETAVTRPARVLATRRRGAGPGVVSWGGWGRWWAASRPPLGRSVRCGAARHSGESGVNVDWAESVLFLFCVRVRVCVTLRQAPGETAWGVGVGGELAASVFELRRRRGEGVAAVVGEPAVWPPCVWRVRRQGAKCWWWWGDAAISRRRRGCVQSRGRVGGPPLPGI
jgi:hypothetical protein